MNKLKSILSSVIDYFRSPSGQAALHQAAELAPKAAPIVYAIEKAAGNRTVTEIAGVYAQYGIPFAADFLVMGPGPALLHLASTVLIAQLEKGTSKTIVDTAVQLAVAGQK